MNKVVLMGRLTKDPELRYSQGGNNTAVCNFTIAVDRRFKKEGEEKQADFIPIVAFGKTGEFVSKYFAKGTRIILSGSIQTRTWDDAEGKRHYVTEVIADEVEFADSKKENNDAGQERQKNPPQNQQQNQQNPPPSNPPAGNTTGGGNTPPWLRK